MLKETISCIQVIDAAYRMVLEELKEAYKVGAMDEPYVRDLYSCARTLRELVGQALYETYRPGISDMSLTNESQTSKEADVYDKQTQRKD